MKKLILVGVSAALGFAQAATFYWKGGSSGSELYSDTSANWCTDAGLTTTASTVPADGDDLVFVAESGSMIWRSAITVGNWTQQAGYAGTVTFYTGRKNGTTATLYGYTTDSERYILKISGNCSLAGGTWTHSSQPSMAGGTRARTSGEGVYRLIAEVGGTMSVDNTTLTAVGCGYGIGQAPISLDSHCSGVHAGVGGWHSNSSKFGNQGPCYGTFRAPVTLGSAGASNSGSGSIELTVAGALTVGDGAVFTVAGKEAPFYVGAGGSICITAASIAGSGSFNARGAYPTSGYGGGGGGGRIAFLLTGTGADFSNFTGTYTTHSPYQIGCINAGYGGTTYFETKADGAGGGVLVVDGTTSAPTTSELERVKCYSTCLIAADGAYAPKKVVLRDAAALGIPEGVTFNWKKVEVENSLVTIITNQIRLTGGTVAFTGETPTLDPGVSLHIYKPATITIGANGTGTLTIPNHGLVECDTNATIQGSVVIADGGRISHTRTYHPSSKAVLPDAQMDLTVTGDLTVRAGGAVSAVHKGRGNQDANPQVHAARAKIDGSMWSGWPYGSLTKPTSYGGGVSNWGTDYVDGVPYGIGGGAVHVTVLGDLTLDGAITADGAKGSKDGGYGSSAGGSVWVRAKSLSGAGSITANGGVARVCNQNKGCGTGGRVAVYLTGAGETFEDFTGPITALPGHVANATVANSHGPGAGTVYMKTGDQAENGGTLLIEGDGSACAYDTILVAGSTGTMTDLDVGSLIVTNGARLLVQDATVKVGGDWWVGGNWVAEGQFTAGAGAVLEFTDASRTSLIAGKNAFLGLICRVPGKRLEFATDAYSSFQVSAGGTLDLEGTADNPLVLRARPEDGYFQLPVDESAVVTLTGLDVKHSDATGGLLLVATDSTVSRNQGNTNWSFPDAIQPGETNAWTGAADTHWSNPANWSRVRQPVATDVVLIEPTANAPVFTTQDFAFNEIAVRAGAQLSLGGCSIAITNRLTVAGALVCTGTETISFSGGTVDFTGGTLRPSQSTLIFSGAGDQTLVPGTVEFYKLTAAKAGGTLTFAASTTVAHTCDFSATAAWTAAFGATTLTCGRFNANGKVGDAAAITLTGSAWTLALNGYASVAGVRVANSSASTDVYATDTCVDLDGNNAKWHFTDEDVVIWQNAVTPAAGKHVIVPSGSSVTLSADTSVGSIQIAGTVTQQGGRLLVDRNAVVVDGGVLTHAANGQTDVYRVAVETGGGFAVTEGGTVSAFGRGYSAGNGPAGAAGFSGSVGARGPSHGGVGTWYQFRNVEPLTHCYDSAFYPSMSGAGSTDGAGGGVIALKVGGTLSIDGLVTANGANALHYSGAGGSVCAICARLVGAGTVQADAGLTTSVNEPYSGGGGRVAFHETVAKDWSSWHGLASAYGGLTSDSSGRTGGAGTVYYRHAGQSERRGTIIIDNDGVDGIARMGTELPPTLEEGSAKDYRRVNVILRNGAKIKTSEDVTVRDIALESSATMITVTNATLTLATSAHRDGAGWLGTTNVLEGGAIRWKSLEETKLILR